MKALVPLKDDHTIFSTLWLHEEDFLFSFFIHFCMKVIFVDSRLKQMLIYPTFLNSLEWWLGKDCVFVFNSFRNQFITWQELLIHHYILGYFSKFSTWPVLTNHEQKHHLFILTKSDKWSMFSAFRKRPWGEEMRTPWSELLCASLLIKYDKGQVCVCVKNKNNLSLGMPLKNANNEKNILINTKSKIKKSYVSGYELSSSASLHCQENSHFFFYNSGLGSSLAG